MGEIVDENLEEAEGLWDYTSWDHDKELSFKAGDVIKVRKLYEDCLLCPI